MFSMPCIAAPTISDCEREPVAVPADELHHRLDAAPASGAIATASGEACACAAVLSVALTASTHGRIGASWR